MSVRLALMWLALASLLRAADPVVWRVDSLVAIGGHPVTEVVGEPKVVDGALEFGGTADGVYLEAIPLAGWREFTVEVLFFPATGGPEAQRFVHFQDGPGSRLLFETRLDRDGRWWLDTFLWHTETPGRGRALIDPKLTHPTGRWYWAALRYDGRTMTSFVNGVQELQAEYAFGPLGSGRVSLGVRQNKVSWFKGRIRELRFHPRALAVEELQVSRE
jgi:hypothetical protein